ncbi:MAG: type II toxin-antitoxin system RelB/DinJ family antitoxin [Oscillospiraceae bacterium]|nr:type II toxin-antitoxin system RelB/DinJ family antitoxin [Oscillospiraceae bacterium]
MAKTETLHIRVNENVKATAEETLSMLGVSISEAVNMFLCQVNLTGGLPFEVKLPAPERVIVRNKEELASKLAEAEEDVRAGRVYPADEAIDRLRGKYGI